MKTDSTALKSDERERLSDCGNEQSVARALEKLAQMRACVGDGLNDVEFTQLVKARCGAEIEGFSFVCFSDGCVTLSVPEQDFAKWYGGERWLAPEKEALAQRIGAKFGLTLFEPPDQMSHILPAVRAPHHLELANERETVVVAHPLYLKLRILCTCTGPKKVLPPIAELFRAVSELYSR